MHETTQNERRQMGCGFEPAFAGATPWQPPSMPGDQALTVCVGYTVQLPIVVETSRLHLHWSKGALSYDQLGEGQRAALELLEQAFGDVQEWATTPKNEGGGGA